MPPYIVTDEQLDTLCRTTVEVVAQGDILQDDP